MESTSKKKDSAVSVEKRKSLPKIYYRTTLPVPMTPRNDISIWSILKQCIGKDMSKVTMPVVFNEPLSLLQRLSEYMEYSELLFKAVNCDNIVDRMQYVAAFAVSALSSNWERTLKPFNPLLGETYELHRSDKGFRWVSEQVSHHPPISAFHVQAAQFVFYGTVCPRMKFWGKSIEVTPKGAVFLEIPKYKELYMWHNVHCCVHNVVMGKLWVENYGVMDIVNCSTNHHCVLNFREAGWFGRDCHKLDGYIYSPDNQKVRALYGSWVGSLFSVDVDKFDSNSIGKRSKSSDVVKHSSTHLANHVNQQDSGSHLLSSGLESTYDLKFRDQKLLWQVSSRPSQSSQYYGFTTFAMTLNEITPGLTSDLPPTDSRLRPDVRNLEDGKTDDASTHKARVEEKQRQMEKLKKKSKAEIVPLWFDTYKNPQTGKEDWKFNGKYNNKDWSGCPSIF